MFCHDGPVRSGSDCQPRQRISDCSYAKRTVRSLRLNLIHIHTRVRDSLRHSCFHKDRLPCNAFEIYFSVAANSCNCFDAGRHNIPAPIRGATRPGSVIYVRTFRVFSASPQRPSSNPHLSIMADSSLRWTALSKPWPYSCCNCHPKSKCRSTVRSCGIMHMHSALA
jgi:hypothetical protein